jgi:hypothetical protein
MRRYLLLGAVCGCASAGAPDPNQNPDGSMTDDSMMMTADARIDAPPPPVMVTLSQLVSTTNAAGNSVVCNSGENSWYRVFPLSDHGVTKAFNVQSVTFGVQEAAGNPTVTIRVGTYASAAGATLNTAMITPIGMMTHQVPAATNPGTNVTVPVIGTVPAGSNLIVEINKTGTNTAGLHFVIGAANGGETKAGYVRAPTCNDAGGTPITQPVTPAAVGRPTAQINIVVTGSH